MLSFGGGALGPRRGICIGMGIVLARVVGVGDLVDS